MRRLSDPADGRGILVELTKSGFARANAAMADHAAVERRLCGMFSADEQTRLATLLSRMILFNNASDF